MQEGEYKTKLIKKIEARFPGCIVLKNDPNYKQGIPDLSVFWKSKWAFLEVKISEAAAHQPNQDYFIEWARDCSYGSFIFPENEEEVLDEMERSFKSDWEACNSKSE